MTEPGTDYTSLRSNVSLLGRLLGETIASAEGQGFLDLVEAIRTASKSARGGSAEDRQRLLEQLRTLGKDELVPVARAFSQFLNLANIADQQFLVSRAMDAELSATQALASAFAELSAEGISAQDMAHQASSLNIELVLTAHPTEIMRRTLIHKHAELGRCLSQLELGGLTDSEEHAAQTRLRSLIAQIWHGDDFRRERPTPVDEAKWGFAVVEDSLWQAVPQFLRRLDRALEASCGLRLALDARPVHFTSWMGGDRDGNPNVTAQVTDEVLLLSRWQACKLYLDDVHALIEELSMTRCTAQFSEYAGGAHEPYREVLRSLRTRLQASLQSIEAALEGQPDARDDALTDQDQLWQPLKACYDSLHASGMALIADGSLLDTLRKVSCFGLHLVRHDIRQESSRHTQVLSELTTWLGIGDYAQWDEPARQAFLLGELSGRRPLIPPDWSPSAEVQEVLDTCAVIARQSPEALGAYVISMARQASDVLAVHLLLKESGCRTPPPVAPLFETLDDLERCRSVLEALLAAPWYRGQIAGQQMVMIGYSDSAKDAGVMAAAWAQYRAQESLLEVCSEHNVELTLFHGRGGTIGRGGAPAAAALMSQPPGSLGNGLRVTEQGEIIRTKLGWSAHAVKTLALYASSIFRANLLTPPAPKSEWRDVMLRLADSSCTAYRDVIRGEADFVPYFRHATPEQELARLPLGSRPARRAGGGGIESLRAIPWIFAWSQNRLMLPAWLGAGAALREEMDQGGGAVLRAMASEWPFFRTRLSMLEMVYAKADADISAHYDERLVPDELKSIGANLRTQLERDRATVLELLGQDDLLAGQDWLRQSVHLRNIYTDPLNFLQAELLRRDREDPEPAVEQAIMVTIAGIAAGMRNTG
ncbi:MAG: phosphoenolpyruvate carboxylase [Pseudomonadota bacterium]